MSTPATGRQRLSEEERRAQILRATITVVARDGFGSASAGRIAEQAGVSKGLIWHYFNDKTDLMRQAVIETVRTMGSEVDADIAAFRTANPGLPLRDYVRALIRRIARHHETRREELRAIDQITRTLRMPDGSQSFSLNDYEEFYQAYETMFRLGQKRGVFGPFDTRVMAVTWQGAIDMMLAYFNDHPGTDTGKYADHLADILLAAMEHRAGSAS